jgi:hypothetical protein
MAHKEVRPIQNLTALVLREDGYWRKKLHRCEMTKAIWHIFPTERQLANPEWLRLNGWQKLPALEAKE